MGEETAGCVGHVEEHTGSRGDHHQRHGVSDGLTVEARAEGAERENHDGSIEHQRPDPRQTTRDAVLLGEVVQSVEGKCKGSRSQQCNEKARGDGKGVDGSRDWGRWGRSGEGEFGHDFGIGIPASGRSAVPPWVSPRLAGRSGATTLDASMINIPTCGDRARELPTTTDLIQGVLCTRIRLVVD